MFINQGTCIWNHILPTLVTMRFSISRGCRRRWSGRILSRVRMELRRIWQVQWLSIGTFIREPIRVRICIICKIWNWLAIQNGTMQKISHQTSSKIFLSSEDELWPTGLISKGNLNIMNLNNTFAFWWVRNNLEWSLLFIGRICMLELIRILIQMKFQSIYLVKRIRGNTHWCHL